MTNSIVVSVKFYFKGEAFSPCVTIDLDMYFQTKKDMNFVYDMLGKNIGLDEYRHEYDVMVMEEVVYSEPRGLAKEYLQDGQLDWQGLKEAWQKRSDFEVLSPIANKFFNVENLEDDPKLASALLAAYRAGQAKSPEIVETKSGLNEGFYG